MEEGGPRAFSLRLSMSAKTQWASASSFSFFASAFCSLVISFFRAW